MIKLKLILEKLVSEVGDLNNIESYSYNDSRFRTEEGWEINVYFQLYNDEELEILNLKDMLGSSVYNIVFSVEGEQSQYQKSSLKTYFKIIKTVFNISKDFVKSRKVDGLTFFAADKKGLFKTDSQKDKLYKAIVMNSLKELPNWIMKDIELDNFKGFMIYNKNNE
jgi:hypothetical protein